MVRKRIAAIVALSLLGALPAGMAWADHKEGHEPAACRKTPPPENNPHCQSGHPGGGHGPDADRADARPTQPTYVINATIQNRCLSPTCDLSLQAQAIENDGDDNPVDGHILNLRVGSSAAAVTESSIKARVNVEPVKYETELHLQRP